MKGRPISPLRVEVTAQNILDGKPNDRHRCPIALAIAQRLSCHVLVDADRYSLTDYRPLNPCPFWRGLPLKAREFINRFDNHLPVAPFTFQTQKSNS